ncbi:TetR/AcrR family transcriptional regulator [Actinomadura fibrosa]|uniref:TetR/AcrR family transcriptional regulator n=1 Tax=Actinomadura fibrosa TaxID=111802 RepID=A0ABW2XNK1_9ACTN|nr:TetR/AcrR family transcriptional regulator [Actinomadura fibrosa]
MVRPSSGMRELVLSSALRLFAQHGYRGTSLQDIASDAGCAKASLLYHFGTKEAILLELLVPVAKDAVALDARLAGLDGVEAAVAAVTGFAELALRYRRELKLLFDNGPEVAELPDVGVDGIEGVGDRLLDAVAGRSTAPSDRVTANLVLGGIAMVGAGDLAYDEATMREAMIGGALRALGRDHAHDHAANRDHDHEPDRARELDHDREPDRAREQAPDDEG